MIRRILLHPRLNPLLLGIFLMLPTFVAAVIYRLIRSRWVVDPRREYFERVFATLASSGTEGDYLEFGVYRGGSFIQAFHLAKKYGFSRMRFFAFDSFLGLPTSEGTTFQEGEYHCSRELFTKAIRKAGVDLDKVRVVEGFYTDSLGNDVKVNHEIKKAALIHVDSDLYVSAKQVLHFVQDLLQLGSIIVFDNWHTFEWAGEEVDLQQFGERRAFEEWSESTRFEVFYDFFSGKAFIMREEV